MVATKFTMILEAGTINVGSNPQRTNQMFGWSESFFVAGDKLVDAATRQKCQDLIDARAKLLPNEAFVRGYRLQTIDPTGASKSVGYYKKGNPSYSCDAPENCLIYQCRAINGTNRRQVILRGLPDAHLIKGEFDWQDANYKRDLRAFFAKLMADWGFWGIDKTVNTKKIKSISAGGVIVMDEASAAVMGDKVQVLRTLAVGHRFKGHVDTITAFVDNKNMTIGNWPHGATKGGKLRVIPAVNAKQVFGISLEQDEIDYPEVASRDTGPPSKRSRGRQSAKYA